MVNSISPDALFSKILPSSKSTGVSSLRFKRNVYVYSILKHDIKLEQDKVTWGTDNAVRYKELNDYIESIINEYYCTPNLEILEQKVRALDHTFVDIQLYGSEIFQHQYQDTISIAKGIMAEELDEEEYDADYLIDMLKILEQQCYREIQMLRWNSALTQLEREFDAYRIGRWAKLGLRMRSVWPVVVLWGLLCIISVILIINGVRSSNAISTTIGTCILSASTPVEILIIVQKAFK